MNLSYLKYAVEVEKTGSITKAAQNFYMNQPHLSKSYGNWSGSWEKIFLTGPAEA